MPSASVWGPYLWKFLHLFASMCGKAHDKFKIDEERESKWLITHIETIIPCKECILHLLSFKKGNPIKGSSMYIEWFWDLHNSVNTKLKKNPGPALEDIRELPGDIKTIWKEYVVCVEDSINQNFIRRTNLLEFQRHLHMWTSYLL